MLYDMSTSFLGFDRSSCTDLGPAAKTAQRYRSTANATYDPVTMAFQHLRIGIENVHCSDCEFTIRQAITHYFSLKDFDTTPNLDELKELQQNSVFYRLQNGQIDIYYYNKERLAVSRLQHAAHKIVSALKKNGFLVLSWELEDNGDTIATAHKSKTFDASESEGTFLNLWAKYKKRKMAQHHMEHCAACKSERETTDTLSVETVVDKQPQELRAVFSINGMSCASCVQAVSETIETLLNENNVSPKGDEPLFSVNLLQHSAVVLVPNKQIVNKVILVIEEAGFSAQLIEVLPIQRSINQKVTALIGGITCAACVEAVLSAVSDLPFILDSGINAVTKSAQFVLEGGEDGSNSHIEKLKEAVEDCGFDFELVKVEKINFTSGKHLSRSINIGVEGMFCTNCPSVITKYLQSFGDAVVIEDPITLNRPFVKFTYVPNTEKHISVRRFLADLNHLFPSDNHDGYVVDEERVGVFNCSLVEKVSIDEHLRRMAKRDIWGIIRRLIIATIFAIPSFIFGIVGMSLVPKNNLFRVWLDEPLWAGRVSRVMWILLILSTPVYFFAADIFHVKALKEIRSLWWHRNSWRKRIFKFGSMSLLMSLGTTVAYIASIVLLILSARHKPMTSMEGGMAGGFHTTYFDSVVFLTFFLLIGRLLESVSKSKTADAVANLSTLKASSATIVERIKAGESFTYGNDQLVEVTLLDSGDFIRISTGESPPVDCVLVEGNTEFDESALTGESDPVKHEPGHQIFSGTVNIGNNAVIAKILSVDGDSLLDQIVSTVRDGQMRKAPIQRVADVLTGYFVPLIVLFAVLTWVIWLSLAYSGRLPASYLDIAIGGWSVWSLEFAIAVFVIACPCGIGLAAPTALFVGSGLAAKYGILAKGGGAAFQDAATTNLVCFDKTGTLTHGKMSVTDFAFVERNLDIDITQTIELFALQLARDLELASKHPIATAVKEFLASDFEGKQTLSSNKIPRIETVPGKGMKGQIVLEESNDDAWSLYKPEEAILGNEALLRDFDVSVSEEQQKLLDEWKGNRKSVVNVAMKCLSIFADDKYHLVAMLACRDSVRAESKQVISLLQKKGIECWMITGDNKLTADAIGRELGIEPERVISEVLPDEKQAKVQMLQKKEGSVVAMVGDGINDAPALATANVGIALSSGADIAVTSSDFILLSKAHPILTLCTLLDLAQVVFRRVKFNFCWALVYNAIGIPIAAGVIYPYKNLRLSPVWASAAMAASSVSVVTSSLLLRLYRPKIRAESLSVAEEAAEQVRIHHVR